MSGMAATAAVRLRMHMQSARAALELVRMAIAAYTPRYPFEKSCLTADMGAMAGDTPRITLPLKMGMDTLKLRQNIGVTL